MIFEKIREKIEKLSLQQKMKSASIFCEEDYIKSTQKQYVKQSCDMQAFAYDKALDIINQVEAEYNNGWIPCSERLPEKFDSVLVSCEGSVVGGTHEGEKCEFVATGYMFSKDHWQIQGHNDVKYIKVIAWQPLPQPPKGE